MEFSSALRMIANKFTVEKTKKEQWRPFNRERVLAKPIKSRRQLFHGNSCAAKDPNDFYRTANRSPLQGNLRKDQANSGPVDSNSDWKLLLEFFHRKLNREIDAVGVERPDGAVEMIKNPNKFSHINFESDCTKSTHSLNEILADGQSQIVDIEYKLVPVIERISIRQHHQSNGECTVYAPKKPQSDKCETLAKFLDDSSSSGYASQTDATASSTSSPIESEFLPIGSSTLSTDAEASDDVQMNADTIDGADMANNLDDSSSSIYHDCEESPTADEVNAIDQDHQM